MSVKNRGEAETQLVERCFMKKIFLVIFLAALFAAGCQRKTNDGSANQIIATDIADISFFYDEGREFVEVIPILLKNKKGSISVIGLENCEIPGTDATISWLEQYKGVDIGYITLKFKAPSADVMQEIKADTVLLQFDDRTVQYKFGNLCGKRKAVCGSDKHCLTYTEAQSGYLSADLTEVLISFQALCRAQLHKVQLSSDEVLIDFNSVSGALREYKPGETAKNLKIRLNGCDSKLYKFDMCLIAEDCVTVSIFMSIPQTRYRTV